jgi:oligopeptide/dipeptide ABC transporter ATP-binding protein
VKVVYGGKIVEEGNPYDIFENPHHPYTIGLINAVPRLDLPRSHGLHTIEGEPPDMSQIPPNCCAFAHRCKFATEECRTKRPEPTHLDGEHYCSCFHMDKTKEEREALV